MGLKARKADFSILLMVLLLMFKRQMNTILDNMITDNDIDQRLDISVLTKYLKMFLTFYFCFTISRSPMDSVKAFCRNHI